MKKNLANYIKKTPVLLALIAVLILPMMVRAYAQEDNTEPDLTAQQQLLQELDQQPAVLESTETPADTTDTTTNTTVEDPAPVDDSPETVVDPDGVTLGEAQIIATTEHAGSTLKAVKTGVFEGNAVYVFKFEDGWKVSVRAIDGVAVEVKDAGEHKHGCGNKLKDDPEFQAWLQARKEQRKQKEASNDDEQGEDKHGSRKHGWAHGRNHND